MAFALNMAKPRVSLVVTTSSKLRRRGARGGSKPFKAIFIAHLPFANLEQHKHIKSVPPPFNFRLTFEAGGPGGEGLGWRGGNVDVLDKTIVTAASPWTLTYYSSISSCLLQHEAYFRVVFGSKE